MLNNEQLRTLAPSIFAREASPLRSERFKPIATIDAVEAMREAGYYPMSAVQCRCRDENNIPFTRHMISFKPESNKRLKVGDTSFRIILRNANDGSSPYILNPGLYRLVCSNGMTVPLGNMGQVRVKHVGEAAAKVVEATRMIVDLSAIALDAPVKWEKVTLAPSQRKAFAKGAAKLRFGEELPFDSELLLQPRRVEDQKVDLWHTFNVVQENLIKGGINYIAHDDEGNSRFAQSRAIKAIDSDVKINTSLWTLAKEYAQ